MTLQALLDAAQEKPYEDAPRLALADWLEHNGDQARAAFIRVQCQISRLPAFDERMCRYNCYTAERWKLQQQERDLLSENRDAWLGWMSEFVREVSFERGMIKLTVTLNDLVSTAFQELTQRPEFGFVQELQLVDVYPSNLAQMVAATPGEMTARTSGPVTTASPPHTTPKEASALAQVSSLSLHSQSIGDAGVETLVGLSALANLRSLRLAYAGITSKGIEALAASPYLSKLVRLDLSGNDGVGEDGARALAASPHLGKLQYLTMYYNMIGDHGLRALVAPDSKLVSLSRLILDDNEITAEGLKTLLQALPRLPLEELSLDGNALSDACAELFSSAAQSSSLKRLSIRSAEIGGSSVAALARSPLASTLKELDLTENSVGSMGAEALAASARLSNLETLEIGYADLGSAGAMHLARSNHMGGLRIANLQNNKIGDQGVREIAGNHGFRSLRELYLSWNELSDESGIALAAADLPNLEILALRVNKLGENGVKALLSSSLAGQLITLDLSSNELTGAAAKFLATANFGRLVRLELFDNTIGDSGVSSLASNSSLRNLSILSLDHNQVSDEGAIALCQSTHLGNIRKLTLEDNCIGEKGQQALRERFGDRVTIAHQKSS